MLFPKEVMCESAVADWFGGGGLHRQHRARSCAARRQTPQPPGALKLLAVPLFELYGNEKRYGAVVSSIPYLISRFHLNLESKAEE